MLLTLTPSLSQALVAVGWGEMTPDWDLVLDGGIQGNPVLGKQKIPKHTCTLVNRWLGPDGPKRGQAALKFEEQRKPLSGVPIVCQVLYIISFPEQTSKLFNRGEELGGTGLSRPTVQSRVRVPGVGLPCALRL